MNEPAIEVSVIIPCLNEARTVAACVSEAAAALDRAGLAGEIIVADNGSVDGSPALARAAGALVVSVAGRGYGNALMTGIAAARGRYIVMGDADGSYDFSVTPQFVAKLRLGFDLVQGCRLPGGGGKIAAGAMPTLHRWLGNPALSLLARLMFNTGLHDVYCGLRGFMKTFYERLNLRCTGMEFATEMIIKSAQHGARVAELPITLRRDGRGGDPSHLRTFRDGWRTLRLFLLCSPRWVFFAPGLACFALGGLGSALALRGVNVAGAVLDVHTLLVAGLMMILGWQMLFFGIFAITFSITEGLRPPHPLVTRFYRYFNLEAALVLSGLGLVSGAALVGHVFVNWRAGGYGPLDYPLTLRQVIPGVVLMALSAQMALGSLLVSMIALARK